MSSETMVSHTCDGPGCDEAVVSDSLFGLTPPGWYSLARPGDQLDDAYHLHFCTVACLNSWTVFARIAVAEGL